MYPTIFRIPGIGIVNRENLMYIHPNGKHDGTQLKKKAERVHEIGSRKQAHPNISGDTKIL